MIGYDEIIAALPSQRTAQQRDEWYEEHGVDADAVVQLGVEIARIALLRFEEGEHVSAEDLIVNLTSLFTQGFELGWRVCEAPLPSWDDPAMGAA